MSNSEDDVLSGFMSAQCYIFSLNFKTKKTKFFTRFMYRNYYR